MRFQEFTSEAEEGTPESKEIVNTLKKAGYKQLGSGSEATVWAKDESSVIKIIMPDEGEDRTVAANTFYKFYEFCQQNSQYENLPKFIDIGGQHHATFKIGDKEYIQVAMERLYPIPTNTYPEAMVWMLSDFASKRAPWDKVYEKLLDPHTWINWEGPQSPEDITEYVDSLDEMSLIKYKVLYMLMTVLYHTGNINKLGWDLHTENVMQRKDGTLVIVDPWFSSMESN